MEARGGDGQDPRDRTQCWLHDGDGTCQPELVGARGLRLGLCSVKTRSRSAGLCTGSPRHTGPWRGSAVKARCTGEGGEERSALRGQGCLSLPPRLSGFDGKGAEHVERFPFLLFAHFHGFPFYLFPTLLPRAGVTFAPRTKCF